MPCPSRARLRSLPLPGLAIGLGLLAGGCGLASPARLSAPARHGRVRVVQAGRLAIVRTRLAGAVAASPSLLLADGALFWLRADGHQVMLERRPLRGGRTPSQALGSLPFALAGHLRPTLLAALSNGSVVAAAVPTTGLERGVVADTWLVGQEGDRRLANLAPKGTRPRFAQAGSVAVGASGWVFLAVGSRAASPSVEMPARDLVIRTVAGHPPVACAVPLDVPADAVWPASGGGFVAAAGGRLAAIEGCPGAMHLAVLARLPSGLYPLLVGTRATPHGPVATWVCGLRGSVLGTWRYEHGAPSRFWTVPATTLAVQAVAPDEVLATAAAGAHTESLLYQAATGRSAGPFRDMTTLATGNDSLIVREAGAVWLLRTAGA